MIEAGIETFFLFQIFLMNKSDFCLTNFKDEQRTMETRNYALSKFQWYLNLHENPIVNDEQNFFVMIRIVLWKYSPFAYKRKKISQRK